MSGSTITIQQPSTGDVNIGTIQPDGSFFASMGNGRETYEGTIDLLNCTGTVINTYTDSTGCVTTYSVSFTN